MSISWTLPWHTSRRGPNIMSIRWTLFWYTSNRPQASGASVGYCFGTRAEGPKHREHQLDIVLAHEQKGPSIMSISCTRFWHTSRRAQASGASAGRCFGPQAEGPKHQEHQLDIVLVHEQQGPTSGASAGTLIWPTSRKAQAS